MNATGVDFSSFDFSVLNQGDPVLPRKQLLSILDDRAETTQFISYRPYTFVALRTWYNNHEYIGYGFSKVCWPDKWDAEEGADRAHRRALIMVLHQVRDQERKDALPF
jgi:hypothetical protein